MLFIIMAQASMIKSSFLMIMTIINFSGFAATKLTKNRSKIMKLLLLFAIINICIIIFCGFSLSYYYKIMELIMEYIVPRNLQDMLHVVFDEKLLPEIIFTKYVISFFTCKIN